MKLSPYISLVVFGVFVVALGVFISFTKPVDAQTLAKKAVDECAGAKDKPACYEKTVPALFPQYSVSEVFKVVRAVRAMDSSYKFCHVLAHKVGEAAVAQDPDKWIDLMSLNPTDGLCSNGFIHGVIGGRFRAEVLDDETIEKLLPQFKMACEPRQNWQASPLDQAICYHGMGHLYMFITDADVPHALALCEETTNSPEGDYHRVCREGVFMQIYQSLEPDDILLVQKIKPTKEHVRSYCATFTKDEYEGACLRESWPYFKDEILSGPGIVSFCSNQPNSSEEESCYQSVFSILGRQSLADTSKIYTACGYVSDERRPMCYEYGARAILEESRTESTPAIDFCLNTPQGFSDNCISRLVETASFMFGSNVEEHRAFCSSLPVNYRASCNP